MNLIFICSYLNVPCVIDAVEREKGDFRILTDDQGLFNLFADIYDGKNVIKLPTLFVSFGNIKGFCLDIVRSFKCKKQLLEVCRELKPTKILFFFLGWNGLSSWLIKKLSTNAEIFYQPEVNLDMLKANSSARLRIKTLLASSIFGIKYKSASYYGYPMIAIDQSFLDRVNAQRLECSIEPNKFRKLVQAKFLYSRKIDVLLLTGGMYNVDEEEYREKMQEVFEILASVCDPANICIKSHPNFPVVEFDFAEQCFVAAVESPANILCYASKCVIGYDSATLYEAADLGLTSICLVNIIPTNASGQKERISAYLLDNCTSQNILFPQDLDELNNLLTQLS